MVCFFHIVCYFVDPTDYAIGFCRATDLHIEHAVIQMQWLVIGFTSFGFLFYLKHEPSVKTRFSSLIFLFCVTGGRLG